LTQKVRKTHASAFLWSLEVRGNEHPRLSGLDEFEQSLILVGCPFTSARRDTRHFFALSPISTRRRMASERVGLSLCFAAHLSTVSRNSSVARSAIVGVLAQRIVSANLGRIERLATVLLQRVELLDASEIFRLIEGTPLPAA
jgi:hypothetical protein